MNPGREDYPRQRGGVMMNKSRVFRFTVPVSCKIPFSEERRTYEDWGILILPDNYRADGEPVRLVMNCHGAGGTVTTDDSQVESQTITRYLVANGFAVMDVNGLPQDYAEEFGIDIRNNIGSPIAVDSNVAAYRYCVENFNLHQEVIAMGSSMGGITSTNLVLSGRIPVLAQAGLCPVLDTYHEIFLRPWCDGLPKTALGMFYSLEKDHAGEWIYEEEKVLGYNPAENPRRFRYPCPLCFCQSENDPIVSPEVTKRFVMDVRSGGGRAELVMLPDGEHEPQLYGEDLAEPSGVAVLDGEKLGIKPGVEALFRFMRSFG